MLKSLLTILLSSCILITGHSQNLDTVSHSWATKTYKKDVSILAGYNQGKYGFADIGLAINYYGTNRHPFSLDYFVSSEIKLDNDVIIGPKIGVWLSGGVAIGLNLIYYTDFDKSSVVFRPEFGFGIDKVKLVYGYNWGWTNSLNTINQHQVGLTYCFTLKRLKQQ